MLTREQIQANIEAFEQQGASQDEIQGWLDTLSNEEPVKENTLIKGATAVGKFAADVTGAKALYDVSKDILIEGKGIRESLPKAIGGATKAGLTLAAPLGLTGNLATRIGQSAVLGGGYGLAQGLEDNKDIGAIAKTTVLGSALGGALPITGVVIKGTGKYLASRVPKLLGIATGEGDDVIRAALENPKAADLGIKNGDEALRKFVKRAGEKSITLRNNFIKSHAEAFKELAGENVQKLVKKQQLIDGLDDILRANRVKIEKNGVLDFTTSKIKANPGEISKIQNAYDAALKWNDFSLAGVNEFKQLIGSFTRFADEAGIPAKSPRLGQYYHYLDELIKDNLPKASRTRYTSMNNKFTNGIELFDDMVDAFNKGDPFTKVANSMGKNKDTLRQIIDFYEKKSGQSIKPIVAGRELAMEKTAAFGFLNPRSWIDFLIAPSVQARGVTGLAKLAPKVATPIRKATNAAGKAKGLLRGPTYTSLLKEDQER